MKKLKPIKSNVRNNTHHEKMLNDDDNNQPHLCIPRSKTMTVNGPLTVDVVREKIEELNLGVVGKITMKMKKDAGNGEKSYFIKVAMESWHTDKPNAIKTKALLLSNNYVKVQYDEFDFWKIYALRENK